MNQREIKFRAWLEDEQEMIGANDFYQNADELPNGDKTGVHLSDFFNQNKDGTFGKEHEKIVWLQYTGLKDKNGKEIYEGDILSNHDNKRYYIVYRKGSYIAQDCLSISDGGDIYKVLYDWGGNSYNGMCYAEIIGNLYETPELLNNKN